MFSSMLCTNVSDIGNICVCRCHSENEPLIIMVGIYNSPGKSMQEFLYEIFFIYSKEGSELLQRKVGIRFDGLNDMKWRF